MIFPANEMIIGKPWKDSNCNKEVETSESVLRFCACTLVSGVTGGNHFLNSVWSCWRLTDCYLYHTFNSQKWKVSKKWQEIFFRLFIHLTFYLFGQHIGSLWQSDGTFLERRHELFSPSAELSKWARQCKTLYYVVPRSVSLISSSNLVSAGFRARQLTRLETEGW